MNRFLKCGFWNTFTGNAIWYLPRRPSHRQRSSAGEEAISSRCLGAGDTQGRLQLANCLLARICNSVQRSSQCYIEMWHSFCFLKLAAVLNGKIDSSRTFQSVAFFRAQKVILRNAGGGVGMGGKVPAWKRAVQAKRQSMRGHA